jgi:hypothetical protein
MLTRDINNAGTDDRIALTVIEEGADRLYHLFPDTSQNDQERAQPNLYEVPEEIVVSAKISPERSPDAGIHIRGDDAWAPLVAFVWGERLGDGAVIPLGLSQRPEFTAPSGNPRSLSTDPGKGRASTLLRPVSLGTERSRIRSLIMLTNTSAEADSGTDNNLTLTIFLRSGRQLEGGVPSNQGGTRVDDTAQEDLETGLPNLYPVGLTSDAVPVNDSFLRSELFPNSIRLEIEGNDAWTPSQFFLFGVDQFAGNSVNSVIPLVHLPEWNLGPLSTDRNEGRRSVVLPLVPLIPIVPPIVPPVPLPITQEEVVLQSGAVGQTQ